MSLTKKYYQKVDHIFSLCSRVKKLAKSYHVISYQSDSDQNIDKSGDLSDDKIDNNKSADKSIEYFNKIESLYLELKSLLSNTPKTIDVKSRKALAVMDSSDSVRKYDNKESFVDRLRSYKITILDKENNSIDNSFIGE